MIERQAEAIVVSRDRSPASICLFRFNASIVFRFTIEIIATICTVHSELCQYIEPSLFQSDIINLSIIQCIMSVDDRRDVGVSLASSPHPFRH